MGTIQKSSSCSWFFRSIIEGNINIYLDSFIIFTSCFNDDFSVNIIFLYKKYVVVDMAKKGKTENI